jgi:membrane protease YdiL (CAAX protease family)
MPASSRPIARLVRLLRSLSHALLVVPWVFLWIAAIVGALELSAEWATLALAVVGAVFLWWNVRRPLRSHPRLAASYRLRPWRVYAGWLTVAVEAEVILIIATLILHEQLAEWRFLPRIPNSPELVPPHFSAHVLGPIAMILAVIVITPLAEEFAFRGRMQSRLERGAGVVPSILIPAVVFSLLHGVTIAAHHLPFAIFVGWVVWRTGSIWTAVYMHALNNAVALAGAYLEPDWDVVSEDAASRLWIYAIAAGVLALGLLLAAGWRIHRVAQINRPGSSLWPRRRSTPSNVPVASGA